MARVKKFKAEGVGGVRALFYLFPEMKDLLNPYNHIIHMFAKLRKTFNAKHSYADTNNFSVCQISLLIV